MTRVVLMVKAKYIKREGTPGHYRYFYRLSVGPQGKKVENQDLPKPKIPMLISQHFLEEMLQDIDSYGRVDKDDLYRKEAFQNIQDHLRSKGVKYIDAYHVTDASLKDFSRKGILGSAVDYVGSTSGSLREESVYMFLDPDDIRSGFPGILGARGKVNNVIHLRLPLSQLENLRWDSNFNITYGTYSSVRLVGNVPSKWIAGVYTYKYTDKSPKKLEKALPHRLRPRASVARPATVKQGEQSPWRAHREYEDQAVREVSDRLLKLFLEIRRKWLKLPGEFHKADTDLFRLNGRIYISPKTGRPLTKKQWAEVVQSLDRAVVQIFKDQPDILVKRAMLLGKVLQGMAYEARKDTDLASVPLAKQKVPDDPVWEEALTFGQQKATEQMVDLSAESRKGITTTILEAIKNRRTTRQLEVALFDEFADLNRDWRRTAETEIASSLNAGLLLAEDAEREPGETVYMIGLSAPGACKECQRLINGRVVVLSDKPVDSGTIKVDGVEYDAIWVGKTNEGRRAGMYWTCVPLHPHCRCSWTRYFKEFEYLLGLKHE